jgi:hypothetical protein
VEVSSTSTRERQERDENARPVFLQPLLNPRTLGRIRREILDLDEDLAILKLGKGALLALEGGWEDGVGRLFSHNPGLGRGGSGGSGHVR